LPRINACLIKKMKNQRGNTMKKKRSASQIAQDKEKRRSQHR
jgi:hypothetical protein